MNEPRPSAGRGPRYLYLAADRFPPTRVDVRILSAELVRRGHEIDWILQSQTPLAREKTELWHGQTVRVGPMPAGDGTWARCRRILAGVRHDLSLVRLSGRRRYDFIQVKDKGFIAAVALLVARWRGIGFVYWMSYPFPDASRYVAERKLTRYPAYHLLRGWFSQWLVYRVVMRRADHVFVQSEQMKQDVTAHGVPPGKVSAVPMGVDTELVRLAGEQRPESPAALDRTERSVVYLGTLSRVRRLDFVLRAFALVRKQRADVRLYLVGGANPDDLAALEQEALRLGIRDHVALTGHLPMPEAVEYVRQADVCLSPYAPTPILNSTSPTKLIEYMAFAKPVVANEHPEQARVLRESGAGLCVAYQEEAFAEAISRLLDDPAGSAAMGRRGREYVLEHRTYDVISRMVDRQYRDLVSAGMAPTT